MFPFTSTVKASCKLCGRKLKYHKGASGMMDTCPHCGGVVFVEKYAPPPIARLRQLAIAAVVLVVLALVAIVVLDCVKTYRRTPPTERETPAPARPGP